MNALGMTKQRQLAMAAAVGGLAVTAWIGALAPAQAQVAVPVDAPSAPAVPTPTVTVPVEDVVETVTPVIEGGIDTVNGGIDTVEDTANKVVGDVAAKLPPLPVQLPKVELPRVTLPKVPLPGPGGGEAEQDRRVTPAPSPVAAPHTGSTRTDAPASGGANAPGLIEIEPGTGPDAAAASEGRRGPGGRSLTGEPIGFYDGLPGPEGLGALDDVGDRIPRWLVAAAAGLLTVVSLGLVHRAMRDEGMAAALAPSSALA